MTRRRPLPASPSPPGPPASPPQWTSHVELRNAQGGFVGDTRVALLEAIDRHGSISQAAPHVPMSYKSAWDAVDAMNNLAEQPLVERSAGGKDGGGTRLTEHGRRLVALYRAMSAEHQRTLDQLAGRQAELPAGDVPALRALIRRMALRTSARNQYAGTVSGLRDGPVDFEVRIRLDEETELAAVVTRESAAQLDLAIGRAVVALVKASALILYVDDTLRVSARNRLWGTVARIVDGPVNAEVTLALAAGRSATAVVTREAVASLGLAAGVRACAAFKVSSVILAVVD